MALTESEKILLSKAAMYLARFALSRLEDELPDPDSPHPDIYWIESFERKLKSVEKRSASIKKLIQDWIVVDESNPQTKGYYQYVTSRVHEFGALWIQVENKNKSKPRIGNWWDESPEDRQAAFNALQEEHYNELVEENILEDFKLDSWEQFQNLIKKVMLHNFKPYSFTDEFVDALLKKSKPR